MAYPDPDLIQPRSWRRFVRAVKANVPVMPNVAQTRFEERREAVGRGASIVGAAADGLGPGLPAPVAVGVSVATAGDAEAVADTAVDTGIGAAVARFAGSGASAVAGGVVMTLRGGHQSLSRSFATRQYLLQFTGYTTTLGRMSVDAMRRPERRATPPTPPIPQYIRETGDMYSRGNQEAFLQGYRKALEVIATADTLGPADRTAWYPSKECLVYLGAHSGLTGARGDNMRQIRVTSENIIVRHILGVNLQRQRQQLRDWNR